ncbi:MAG TPA: isoprenylcysteine carboxylmethyltransferase family protein [Bacillales bacterium]|nr:isoprenylcysteine carboxylmethyltransferase family protein [Bacillales bacterium]
MQVFWIFIVLLMGQRLVELAIAKRNEKWMKDRGAKEVGAEHYKFIVALHVLFFISLIIEVAIFGSRPADWWAVPFLIFMGSQVLRFWALISLGKHWNTKIIVLPGAEVVVRGPYRFIRHPNYLIVAIEIFTVPVLFQAYVTAVLFSILNAIVLLGVRIPKEAQALKEMTNSKDFSR